MHLLTFIIYFCFLILIAFLSYKKQRSEADFILGNRSLNFWLTALSAHASDMSSWLFLGYPAMLFATGLFGAWAAIGLTTCMFLNWHFIAPKLRMATEQSNSLTLNSYFETRFGDTSGAIRIVSAAMSILFFTFYISSGLVAMGVLVDSLFNVPYTIGISIGLIIVALYIFLGGYRTIAWIDLIQGFFLLGVLLFITFLLLIRTNGFSPIMQALATKGLSVSLFPDLRPATLLKIFLGAAGWGLGYFGQPHILTKFMGIRRVSEMAKAKWLGISWQILALTSATLIGVMGVYFFPNGLEDPQYVVLQIVQATLPAFFAGLVLCAVLAATTNVMAAQMLVVASNLTEDFYKRLFRRTASSSELLWISRTGVIFIAGISFTIAYFKISTVYELVHYSWSGLGASFGPLLILSLYRKSINRYGAFLGILVGGITAAIWPYFEESMSIPIPALVAGFFFSLITIEGVSFLTRQTEPSIKV